jgi:cation:H+ antiporter
VELLTIALFLAGIVLLILGAELLVRGAARLAVGAGISPLVVGLTVVAFGTSSPELAVGVQAALSGDANVALGNVVGSNIANVLLILGLAALIAPLMVAPQIIRQEVPLMIGASVLVLLLAFDGALSRVDGALLLAGMVLYTVFTLLQARRASRGVREEYAQAIDGDARGARRRWPLDIALVLVGLVLLTLGADWLVGGATAFATALGVSDLVIGLTVVAVGTSLPEIASSVLASLRGERDIAVGNVVGSCLFNVLAVLGVTAAASPTGVTVPQAALQFDLPVMLATAVACLPIFVHRGAILRWEGAVFLGYYVAYTVYLLLSASHHALLGPFSMVMLAFVVPLTVITVLVITGRFVHAERRARLQRDTSSADGASSE